MSKIRGLNLRLLKRITERLAAELFPNHSHEIEVYFLSRKKMAQLNQKFLDHEGATDVITFDYGGETPHGDIVICPEEAVAQAKQFGTTPQMELVRYLVHGLLHLLGHDDRQPAQRRKMKQSEDKWLRWAAREFPCDKVWSRKPPA